jgi:LmbE family N-acetylglucosaminyl deacetylase
MAKLAAEKMTVLVVGAHPDDIELGTGGTVARHVSDGVEVHFLVLTSGERGGSDSFDREKEATMSAHLLKVASITFGHLPDTQVSDGIETITIIENLLNKIKPRRVYTQSPRDRHQDHRKTALATFSAARNIREIYSYESPDSYPDFIPQYYVDVTKTISQKIEALKLYKSQKEKRFLETEAIEGLAKFRGYQISVPYAEAFEVVKIIRP